MFERVLFLGSKRLGLNVLRTLCELRPEAIVGCVTVDDSCDTRSELDGFREFCENSSLPFDVLTGPCDISAQIDKYRPDLCVVVGWYYLIKQELIDRVRGGFVGVHNSLLPSYRGFAPAVWAMLNGENETGFSIFLFDKGMDTGKLFYQQRVPIAKSDYIGDLLDKIDAEVVSFFCKHFSAITDETMIPYEQPDTAPSYCAKRTPEHGRIDWSRPAEEIYDCIRAQSKPYPGAFTEYKGKTLKIWRASPYTFEVFGQPGQIAFVDSETGRPVISCGGNSGLVLELVEYDGRETDGVELPISLTSLMGSELSSGKNTGGKDAEFALLFEKFMSGRRNEMRAKYDRVLPSGELIFNRFDKGRYLNCGKDSSVYDTSVLIGDVSIGEHTWVGPYTLLDGSAAPLTIGNYVSIDSGVMIYTHDSTKHYVSGGAATFEKGAVSIGDNSVIGTMSIISYGVSIGDHCVVGAHSFVREDIPSYSIVAGVPAKVIGEIKKDSEGCLSFCYFKK